MISMKDEDILDVIDQTTTLLGDLLMQYQELDETTLYDNGIKLSQDRIEKKRDEVQKIRSKLQDMKDANKRRKEAENQRNVSFKDSK